LTGEPQVGHAAAIGADVDGRVVCNTCEDWRMECEARWVCRLPDKQARVDYLASVEKRRGKAHADDLRAVIRAVWQKTRA
jgi:hypothetical protein